MATQLVPYNTAMQLGSGFNSLTQILCIDHAVVRDADMLADVKQVEAKEKDVAQSVTYKTSIISKTTDITDEMNINGAFNIKYYQLNVDGSGKFINTNKIKDSDVSIMVSVKVVNQTIYDHSLIKFQPITNIKKASPQRLIEVYGDSFIPKQVYLDYKSIFGAIQVLAFDVSEGTKALVVNPRAAKAAAKEVSPGTDAESVDGSVIDVTTVAKVVPQVVTLPPPSVEEPFAPTIGGLDDARLKCRFMMNRIIQEIDNITIKPEIVTNETRQTPYLSPFLFKLLLTLGVDLPAEAGRAAQAVAASKVEPDALAKKFTAMAI